MIRTAAIVAFACAGLAACGGRPTETLAPTPETVAFLKLQPQQVSRCVDVEGVVVDAVAGAVTGNVEAAVANQVQQGLARCGEVAGLIDPARFPAAQRPRAEACRTAFAAKVDAYSGLSRALQSEGDFMAAQQGARAFLGRMREARPAMERCNTAA